MKKRQSPEIEEYLETLVRYEEEGKAPKVKEIAKELKVSPASVSEMFKKLSSKGLAQYERYGDVKLTTKGKRLGKSILRKHRFIEKFLMFVGVKKNKIHHEACVLEHALSDDVEKALRSKFSGCIGNIEDVVPLSEMKTGGKGKIVLIRGGCDSSKRLTDLGLTPGTEIEVSRSSSRAGPVELILRSSCLAVGRGVASKIFVEVSK
jgi:DtxR family transcriptional regulator, Mn-dependent transcriptional regulator